MTPSLLWSVLLAEWSGRGPASPGDTLWGGSSTNRRVVLGVSPGCPPQLSNGHKSPAASVPLAPLPSSATAKCLVLFSKTHPLRWLRPRKSPGGVFSPPNSLGLTELSGLGSRKSGASFPRWRCHLHTQITMPRAPPVSPGHCAVLPQGSLGDPTDCHPAREQRLLKFLLRAESLLHETS